MRPFALHGPSFVGGFTAGLGLLGVALLTRGRVRRRALAHRDGQVVHPVIDGARPIDPVLLSARPAEEVNDTHSPLVSEAQDPAPQSQRW